MGLRHSLQRARVFLVGNEKRWQAFVHAASTRLELARGYNEDFGALVLLEPLTVITSGMLRSTSKGEVHQKKQLKFFLIITSLTHQPKPLKFYLTTILDGLDALVAARVFLVGNEKRWQAFVHAASTRFELARGDFGALVPRLLGPLVADATAATVGRHAGHRDGCLAL